MRVKMMETGECEKEREKIRRTSKNNEGGRKRKDEKEEDEKGEGHEFDDLPDDDVVNERGINASAINECIKDRSTEGDGVPLAETSVLLGTRGAYCADNVCVHNLWFCVSQKVLTSG